MRKTKSVSKNHLTGTVKEVEKLKPADAVLRGVHNIQLFRASDGELVHEMESENFIGIAWDDIQKSWAKAVFFATSMYDDGAYNKRLNSSTNLLSNMDSNYNSIFGHPIIYTNSLFTNMYLTNCTEAERPLTERAIFGELVGWAGRENTYSGSSSTQGSFNSAESFKDLSKKQFHFVWDFPTHAANGTFQSLYWGASSDNGQWSPLAAHKESISIKAPDGYLFDYNDSRGSYLKGTKFYVGLKRIADSKFSIGVWDIDISNRTVTPDSLKPVIDTAATANYLINDFAVASDGTIYYTQGSGSFYIYRLDADGNAINHKDGRSSWHLSEDRGYGYKPIYIDENDVMYLGQQVQTVNAPYTRYGSWITARSLNDCSHVRTPREVYAQSYESVNFVPSQDYDVLISRAGTNTHYSNLRNLTEISGTMDGDQPRGFVRGWTYGSFMVKGKDNEPECMTLSNADSVDTLSIDFNPIGMIGGRNLLPEPVTKTNEYTMKVTYDLFFE